jgi:hypothetical protein
MSDHDDDHCDVTAYQCKNCGDPCHIIEETFDFSGTHCNGGQDGTHNTGEYSSECCDAGFEELIE